MVYKFPPNHFRHINPSMNIFGTKKPHTPPPPPSSTVNNYYNYKIMTGQKNTNRSIKLVNSQSEHFAGVLPDDILWKMPIPLPVSGKKGEIKVHEVIDVDAKESDIHINLSETACCNVDIDILK